MKRLIAWVCCLCMLLGCMVLPASAAESSMLTIPWSKISSVGKQPQGSDACGCYALAYARTILDNKVHYWSEYDYNGGNNVYDACAYWASASYTSALTSSASDVYKQAYQSIKNGRPFIVRVAGSRSNWHYITIVGYTNVSSTNSLSAKNFLIIDAVKGTPSTSAENMASAGYNLQASNGQYQYCYTTKGSASTSTSGTTSAPKMWLENASSPTSITQGNNQKITGTLKSNNGVKWVYVGIFPSGEKTALQSKDDPVWKTGFASSYSIDKITSSLDLSKLDPGEYLFTVQCMDDSNNYFTVLDQKFTVGTDSSHTCDKGEYVHFPRVATYTQGQFTDVPASQWFTKNVAEAVELGLMKGSSATTFKPYGDVTLAEAITMAARIHSIYTTGSENFVQSSGSAWYQVYLDYAYRNGISQNYYTCDVTKKATRAQYAEIFANALPDKGLEARNTVADNAIPDVPLSQSYADAVYKLYRAGILAGGDVKGTFSPLTYITRAESATIVARMANTDNRMDFSLS